MKQLFFKYWPVIPLAYSVGIGAVNFATGSWPWGLVSVACVLYWAWYTRRNLRQLNPEPVPVGPTPTDKAPKDNWFAEHVAEHPDCVLCRNLGWIE